MKAWESIQKTLEWIEENISEKMEVEKLSEVACLSPFYYQRLFSVLVGKPVMEYIKLRRLSKAADYLSVNPVRIMDAAFQFGFENHETFTRNFKDTYGLTPEEFRKAPRPLSHFLMPELSLNYYLVDENVPIVTNGIILEMKRKSLESPRVFTGYSVQNPICNTPGIDYLGELWTKFHGTKSLIKNPHPENIELGVSYPGIKKDTFTYFAGTEVLENSLQEGFENWLLTEGSYVVCSFEAENFYQLTTNALNKARDYLFGVWLPHHNLTSAPFMAELYYKTTPETTYMEIWVKVSGTDASALVN